MAHDIFLSPRVARRGAGGDWFDGNGAENRPLRLAIRAMQRQPCEAGFIDARTASFAADIELPDGENRCILRRGFARRGPGVSAVQGSTASNTDNTGAFDAPEDCNDPIVEDGSEVRAAAIRRRDGPPRRSHGFGARSSLRRASSLSRAESA